MLLASKDSRSPSGRADYHYALASSPSRYKRPGHCSSADAEGRLHHFGHVDAASVRNGHSGKPWDSRIYKNASMFEEFVAGRGPAAFCAWWASVLRWRADCEAGTVGPTCRRSECFGAVKHHVQAMVAARCKATWALALGAGGGCPAVHKNGSKG